MRSKWEAMEKEELISLLVKYKQNLADLQQRSVPIESKQSLEFNDCKISVDLFCDRPCAKLLNSMPLGVFKINIDGEILQANKAYADMTERSIEDLVGMKVGDLVDVSENGEGYPEMLKKLARDQKSPESFYATNLNPSGRKVRVRVDWGYDRTVAGNVIGFNCTIADVTETNLAFESLSRSEALFRALIEQPGEGIGVVDSQGSYLLANSKLAEMTQYSVDEITSLKVHDLVSDREMSQVFPLAQLHPAGVQECELKRKDGTGFVAEIGEHPIKVNGEKLVFCIVRDVTERRKNWKERIALESKIQQAQKLESLGVLAGGIAHDFNNLLVGILGNAGLALMDLSPEAPARPFVQRIEATSMRASELIKQMLAYSGKGKFLVERIALESVIAEMTHLLEISISKKAVLKYEFGENVPLVDADATQVRQTIMNLIINASEAIGDRSGVISISTGAMECDRDYLSETYLDDDLPDGIYSYIEVSDSGSGMDRATREKIFDPFFSTKFTGRGLGLAAVLGIVRGHRGAIKVYTELNKGSTFKVLLPAVSGFSEERPSAPPLEELTDKGGVALLIDDEETVRAVGKDMLERLGFEVDTACDGRQGLEKFKADPKRYRIVLLDLTMPHMGGEDCFRELRRVRKDVCVVLSSGYNEQELITRFAGKGLAGFIQKPYRLVYLSRKIEQALIKCDDKCSG